IFHHETHGAGDWSGPVGDAQHHRTPRRSHRRLQRRGARRHCRADLAPRIIESNRAPAMSSSMNLPRSLSVALCLCLLSIAPRAFAQEVKTLLDLETDADLKFFEFK